MPPDPWDDDTAYDERGDNEAEDEVLIEDNDDDEGSPFTRTNPFGEKD